MIYFWTEWMFNVICRIHRYFIYILFVHTYIHWHQPSSLSRRPFRVFTSITIHSRHHRHHHHHHHHLIFFHLVLTFSLVSQLRNTNIAFFVGRLTEGVGREGRRAGRRGELKGEIWEGWKKREGGTGRGDRKKWKWGNNNEVVRVGRGRMEGQDGGKEKKMGGKYRGRERE